MKKKKWDKSPRKINKFPEKNIFLFSKKEKKKGLSLHLGISK
jgi:hypothetical protein